MTVYVDDENDNAPVFEHPVYEGTIKENCISGTEVEINYPIKVTDADTEAHAQASFTLIGEGSDMIRIDKHTGHVFFNSANNPLDREEKERYNMRLIATDKGGLKSEVTLNIAVLDENDNPPQFMQIYLIGGHGIEVLNRTSIPIIDENKNISYSQTVTNKRKRGSLKNHMPFFGIPEHVPIGSAILKILAKDKDIGTNAEIKYEITSETFIASDTPTTNTTGFHITQYFSLNPSTGELIIAKPLPAETEFRLNITAKDLGGLNDVLTIRFHITDENDHAPVFDKSFYSFSIEEGFHRGAAAILGQVQATDADFGDNANVSYSLFNHHNDQVVILPFVVHPHTGVLRVNETIDRERRDKYSFTVIAKDGAKNGGQLTGTVEVDVNILDVNDNAPRFYGFDEIVAVAPPEAESIPNHSFESTELIPVYYATVAENSPVGTPITRVFANDSDFQGNGNGLLLFDIPQRKNKNLFAVDSKDGIVTTTGRLDYEAQNTHNVTVVAADLGSPSLSSSALLVVTVIDVPDDSSYAEVPVFAHRYIHL